MAVMDIVVRATDNASAVMDEVGRKGSKSANLLEANWKKVGIAGAAAGVAFEAMARKQAPLTESTKRLAASTDMTEDEVRALATSMTNVTFPMEDVLDLMEAGRQQGLKTGAELERFANFWDMVGDATGEAGPKLGEAGVALRAVGIDAKNSDQALAAFGFITESTTMEIADFLRLVGRVAPEMGPMGLSIDNVAALLGAMEAQGMNARVAQAELQQAMKSADGDMNVMLQTLGITAEEFESYTQKVEESSEVIQRNAEIHAESYTIMEKLQASAEGLMYQYGDMIGIMGSFAPVMMGLGPAMKGIAMAQSLAAVAATKFGMAQYFALGPVLLIIAAIAVAALIAWYLYKNWDVVSVKIMAIWEKLSRFFSKILERVVGFFKDNWKKILAILFPVVGIPLLIAENWGPITEFFAELWDTVVNIFKGAWDGMANIVKGAINSIIGFVNGMIGAVEHAFNSVIGIINAFQLRFPGLTIAGKQIIPEFVFSLPKLPLVSLPQVPLLDTGGLIQGPGIFGVGAGVTEIARVSSPSVVIQNLIIYAETAEGGRRAGRAFVDTLHRQGIRLEGIK